LSTEQSVSVFISHRHVDAALADVFREEISDWCGVDAQIYQSSHQSNASRVGAELGDEVTSAIWRSDMVLLICTDAPGNYDWPMYEVGLAQTPGDSSANLVVFYTTDDIPDQLAGRIGVPLKRQSVAKFVHDFHRSEGTLANHQSAFRPDITDESVERLSDRLYERLKLVAPRGIEDVAIYDRITLAITAETADQIIETGDSEGQRAAFKLAEEVVPPNSTIRSSSGDPQEFFSFDEFETGMSLEKLVSRWERDLEEPLHTKWEPEVCRAIAAAIMNRPERDVSVPFLSANGKQWLLPMLARYRRIPYEEILEFDVLLCKLESASALGMIQGQKSTEPTQS
jgi:hypothetical protein